MKLHTQERTILSNVEGSESFKIKSTAKAFKILSSNLYKDKILAIIRELSCNAIDAHIAANKEDEPITIHLPNTLEPWFAVIDNGIGLSEEDVFNLYTTYFDSTKGDSNDFTGALGLGSKSPFSYVSSYTLISRFNNTRTTYSAYLKEDGTPAVSKVHEEAFIGNNGFEVQVPINESDFFKFEQKMNRACFPFKVKPIIIGGIGKFEYCEPEITISHEDFVIIKDNGIFDYNIQFYTKQGNVIYPIELGQCDEELTAELKRIFRFKYYSSKIILNFNLGDLDISASREELSYDKDTVSILNTRLNKFFNDIKEEIHKEFQNQSTYADACRYYESNKYFLQRLQVSNNWKGTLIPNKFNFAKTYDAAIRKYGQSNVYNFMPEMFSFSGNRKTAKRTINFTIHTCVLYGNEEAIFVLKDDKKAWIRKLNHNYKYKDLTVFVIDEDNLFHQRFIKKVGWDKKLVRISELEDVVKSIGTTQHSKGISKSEVKGLTYTEFSSFFPNKQKTFNLDEYDEGYSYLLYKGDSIKPVSYIDPVSNRTLTTQNASAIAHIVGSENLLCIGTVYQKKAEASDLRYAGDVITEKLQKVYSKTSNFNELLNYYEGNKLVRGEFHHTQFRTLSYFDFHNWQILLDCGSKDESIAEEISRVFNIDKDYILEPKNYKDVRHLFKFFKTEDNPDHSKLLKLIDKASDNFNNDPIINSINWDTAQRKQTISKILTLI